MTQADILSRLLKYLPFGWYSNSALIQAVMNAAANVFYFIYTAFDYLRKQSRIQTSTGEFLDYASKDFLGNFLPRRTNESDEDFKKRLLPSLIPYPSTRQGLIDALTNIIGVTPAIYESGIDGGFLDYNFFCDESGTGFEGAYQGIVYLNPQFQPSLSIPVFAVDETFFVDENGFCFSYNDTILPIWTLEDIRLIIDHYKVFGTVIYINDFTKINSGLLPSP